MACTAADNPVLLSCTVFPEEAGSYCDPVPVPLVTSILAGSNNSLPWVQLPTACPQLSTNTQLAAPQTSPGEHPNCIVAPNTTVAAANSSKYLQHGPTFTDTPQTEHRHPPAPLIWPPRTDELPSCTTRGARTNTAPPSVIPHPFALRCAPGAMITATRARNSRRPAAD